MLVFDGVMNPFFFVPILLPASDFHSNWHCLKILARKKRRKPSLNCLGYTALVELPRSRSPGNSAQVYSQSYAAENTQPRLLCRGSAAKVTQLRCHNQGFLEQLRLGSRPFVNKLRTVYQGITLDFALLVFRSIDGLHLELVQRVSVMLEQDQVCIVQ